MNALPNNEASLEDFEWQAREIIAKGGDLLFVPAGVPHRFEESGDNLVVWVVFYGAPGGEQPELQG